MNRYSMTYGKATWLFLRVSSLWQFIQYKYLLQEFTFHCDNIWMHHSAVVRECSAGPFYDVGKRRSNQGSDIVKRCKELSHFRILNLSEIWVQWIKLMTRYKSRNKIQVSSVCFLTSLRVFVYEFSLWI